MALIIMKLCITTLSIPAHSIMTLSRKTLSIMKIGLTPIIPANSSTMPVNLLQFLTFLHCVVMAI
jgi:hypothetical protein